MLDSATPMGSRRRVRMCYPQVTSLWSDYPRLLLRVASPMPLLDFCLYVGNFVVIIKECPPLGSRVFLE